MKPKVAIITWEDAHFEESAEHTPGDKPPEAFMQQSAGWLITHTRKEVVIATDLNVPRGVFVGLQRIPRGMVRKIDIVYPSPKEKKCPSLPSVTGTRKRTRAPSQAPQASLISTSPSEQSTLTTPT